MLEVFPEDITASPRSVPLGMFDSRKCELSFGEKCLDTSTEDSLALPVFTPRNFWRCAYQNEALVPCNHNFSCLDSLWHCLIVCEGSVIRASESDQLWHVLEVTPHGILALRGTVQEFDLLRHFDTDGAQWTQWNTGDWQDWSAIAVRGVHRAARVSTQARTCMPCIARCDLRFGLALLFGSFWNSVRNEVFQIVVRGTSASW